ncbi:MAG: ring-cleaving dioxygenase [Balneolaceae bacterium]|nr:ring-cleaving dioxygenase [Balneolaceae bacterium]
MSHHKGIHHITAVAGDPQQNLDFYTDLLGMRLVKKTINFDDPSVYHLYYGDETGKPGSILTFFPWSHLQSGEPGEGQVVAIAFAVPENALNYWSDFLENKQVDFMEPFERFGKQVIGFQDPDGLHLELVADPKVNEIEGRPDGSHPQEYAIRGFHGATLAEKDCQLTGQLLETHLGFTHVNQLGDRYLFETDAEIGSVIEIIDQSELNGKPGTGTVHHIAFRAENEEEQMSTRRALLEEGYHLTEQKDRQYFKSVYFHEAGGILFEVATDGPGFATDESLSDLGTSLQLPPWLEKRRNLIEADLPELQY